MWPLGRYADYTAKWPLTLDEEPQGARIVSESATIRYPPGIERCLKKLVLEAETTGFQDPARTARSPQREELCWKGSVGGQWVYTHESRRAKKLIPIKTLSKPVILADDRRLQVRTWSPL